MKQKRDKRMSLVVPTDIFDSVTEIAQIRNCTINDLANEIFEKLVSQNLQLIEQHKLFKLQAQKNFSADFAQI